MQYQNFLEEKKNFPGRKNTKIPRKWIHTLPVENQTVEAVAVGPGRQPRWLLPENSNLKHRGDEVKKNQIEKGLGTEILERMNEKEGGIN